ncbi:MAG: hypothetical protein ABI665_12335 [Vicinamibacterales bacterium]
MTRIRWACAAGLVAIAISCRAAATPSLDDLAERYVRLTLRLAQHNPDLVDDWRGPQEWKPGPREPVAATVGQIDVLREDIAKVRTEANRARLDYLVRQLEALTVAGIRLSGGSTTFEDEVSPRPGTRIDAPAMARARQTLGTLLPGTSPLAARYAAYRAGLAVPAARVEPVMRAALAACRDASREMRLPADERVDLVFGHGSQWDGFARYLGDHRTRIEINLDASLDVTRALRLACHEGYPGHHAQNVLIDDELVQKRGWQEFALAPAFGQFLFITEGAAEVGADVAFPTAKRAELYRTVLLPAAGQSPAEAGRLVEVEDLVAQLEPAIVDIVRAYLANTTTQADAMARLRDEALTPNPEGLLAFAERRRARSLAYTLGRAEVRSWIGDTGIPGLRRLFTDLAFALH